MNHNNLLLPIEAFYGAMALLPIRTLFSVLQNQFILFGLLLQIVSIIFIWRTATVSNEEIFEFEQPVMLDASKPFRPIFGSKRAVTTSTLYRQYRSFMGMVVLFIGIFFQMLATVFSNKKISPIPLCVYLPGLIASGVLTFLCGERIVKLLFKKRIIEIFRIKALKWGNAPKKFWEDAKEELSLALGDQAASNEIKSIVERAKVKAQENFQASMAEINKGI